MSEFSPILILLIVWIFVGLPVSKLGKMAKQQQARNAGKQGAAKRGPARQEARPEEAAQEPEAPAERVLRPTITVTEHDDSIYQGSMNAVTGEGYDPCHDEQLAPLTAAESAFTAPAETVPGLRLSWNGNEVVRGLVMSEILNRKRR